MPSTVTATLPPCHPSQFAQIDFVDFIRCRDLPVVRISELLNVEIFNLVLSDFTTNKLSLEQVTSELAIRFPLADFKHLGLYTATQVALAIPLASYCLELPVDDIRHVRLTLPDRLSETTVDTGFWLQYESAEYTPKAGSFNNSLNLRRQDELSYIHHWMKAYPDYMSEVLSNSRFLARLISSGSHGADEIAPRLSDAFADLTINLPHVSCQQKFALVCELSRMCSVGLIVLNFDPETEFPEYF